jgi:hypothetical protein
MSDPVIEGFKDALVRVWGIDRRWLDEYFSGVVARSSGGTDTTPSAAKPLPDGGER